MDTNDGGAFPAPLLLAYRTLHEAWVAREQTGTSVGFGWIHSIRVRQSPVFRSGAALHLGKVTLLHGKNSTGKSAMAEWLAGAADPRFLRRWASGAARASAIQLEVTYFAPEEHVVRFELNPDGLAVFLDRERFSTNPLPFGATIMTSPRYRRDGVSDLQYVSEHLRMDPLVVQDLLKESARLGTGWVQAVHVDDSGGVEAAVGGRAQHPYSVLGGGAQVRLAVECAITHATQSSQFGPTLLVLDHGMGDIDAKGWGRDVPFQSLLVSHDRLDTLSWRGWEVAVLAGRPPDTQISQAGIRA